MLIPCLEEVNSARVILASGSKERGRILGMCGVKFEQMSSEYEEDLKAEEFSVEMYVSKTSEHKLEKTLSKLVVDETSKRIIVICGDTMIEQEGRIIGKPKDEEDAYNILNGLSGKTVRCVTVVWIAFLREGELVAKESIMSSTDVEFAQLSLEEINSYVHTGEPMGKAGAFAIQGLGGAFVKRINGCFYNVCGFPLNAFSVKLKLMLIQYKHLFT